MVPLLTMNIYTLIPVAACLLISTLPAQAGGEESLLRSFTLEPSFQAENPGVGLGDLNGDGIGELLIGEPGAGSEAGRATVHSGADGSILYRYFGTSYTSYSGSRLGLAVANAGDRDGDGLDDFLISDPGRSNAGSNSRGYVRLYSGATGAVIQTIPGITTDGWFGSSLAMLRDLDGDGLQEMIVGDVKIQNQVGAVHVYASASNSLLFSMAGEGIGDYFGDSVADAGDVNNDGKADILVGALGADTLPIVWGGAAYVFSGADGTLLRRYAGNATSDRFGNRVGGLGDIDGDGHADVLICAPYTNRSLGEDLGTVYVYSGRTSELLWSKEGVHAGDSLGSGLEIIEDLDGDLQRDVLLGARGADPNGLQEAGMVYLVSGATGAPIHSFEGVQANALTGIMIGSAGDVDQDGYEDFTFSRTSYLGSHGLDVVSFHTFLQSDLHVVSASMGGTANLDFDFPSFAASYDYKVLFSKTGNSTTVFGVDIPLTQDYLTVDSYFGNYPMSVTNMHGILDANGDGSASFSVPAGLPSSLIGQTFWFAAIAAPPGQLPTYSSIAIALKITL